MMVEGYGFGLRMWDVVLYGFGSVGLRIAFLLAG